MSTPRGELSGIKKVVICVHLYQWGDSIAVRGDEGAKRMGTPDVDQFTLYMVVLKVWLRQKAKTLDKCFLENCRETLKLDPMIVASIYMCNLNW